MNFFEHQDRARGTTRTLVLLFACAVAALIVMATLLIYGLLFYSGETGAANGLNYDLLFSDIFVKVSLGVIAVVVLGTLFRMGQLSGGGKSVAEGLGGRLIDRGSRDADERKILNVVEEMAIASGTPVPPVYLLEDPAINAFAAGYKPEDAVIGVTRGCIEKLDRDELQGVIAHEFSHIFNGDMRLNIRLIGILYGIMVIGLIGYYMMRGSAFAGRRNRRGGGLVLAGLGLMVIGYGGTFFGNLIKAAVSRQREFLADASAVQFTRNPAGIGGALKKIGGFGSKMESVNSAEISHMLFEEGGGSPLIGLFATHPPLEERIRRIEPHWQPESVAAEGYAGASASPRTPAGASGFAGGEAGSGAAAGSAVDAIGAPAPEHLEAARRQLASLPPALAEQVHSSLGARAVVQALLAEHGGGHGRHLDVLEAELDERALAQFRRVHGAVRELPRELVLPLLDLALPALKQFAPAQYREFMSLLGRLILADERITLFEWSLFRILRHNLDPGTGRSGKLTDIKRLDGECEILLSALACAGHEEAAARRAAFEAAAELLGKPAIRLREEYAGSAPALDRAMDGLKALKPLQKPLLLKAMVRCIDADGRVKPAEGELLRAVASLLDCPIPPLLSGQKFA